MIKISKNTSIQSLPPVFPNSSPFPYPIKKVTGYIELKGSAETGIGDFEQARIYAESFIGTEVLFDILQHADSRIRVIGHMYADGNYGGMMILSHAGLYYYNKFEMND